MGYTTDFQGVIDVAPPLNAEEIAYLQKFNSIRHMTRKNRSAYYVDGKNDWTQGSQSDDDIFDYNRPPEGVPGLWCGWEPSEDGESIRHDGDEKFYNSLEWMVFLIEHFIGKNPKAKAELPFLQGHVCNGVIKAQGEAMDDRWKLIVKNNVVSELPLE